MRITTLFTAAGLLGAGLVSAAAQEAPVFLFEGDLVRGAGPTAKGPGCVLNNQFKRTETIVWRVRVLDPKTGKPVDDKGLKTLVVELPNGEKIPMSYRGHPPRGEPTDFFWTGAWIIPEDHPTGSLSYKIVATDGAGHSANWTPFKVATSELSVVAN